MTMADELLAARFRKVASWAVFLGLLMMNVVLAVNLTAARHEIAKIKATQK